MRRSGVPVQLPPRAEGRDRSQRRRSRRQAASAGAAARQARDYRGRYQQQGRKLIQEEHFAEAIEPLTQAVKLDPFLATTFNARGYAYFRLKKYKEAIADFDQAIKLNPAVRQRVHQSRSSARRAAGDKSGRGRRPGEGAGAD